MVRELLWESGTGTGRGPRDGSGGRAAQAEGAGTSGAGNEGNGGEDGPTGATKTLAETKHTGAGDKENRYRAEGPNNTAGDLPGRGDPNSTGSAEKPSAQELLAAIERLELEYSEDGLAAQLVVRLETPISLIPGGTGNSVATDLGFMGKNSKWSLKAVEKALDAVFPREAGGERSGEAR